MRRLLIAFRRLAACLVVSLAAFGMAIASDEPPAAAEPGDIPATFEAPKAVYDFEKREVMIPMRDGVKLFTVIVIPKGATHAPIVLDRTPYSAAKFVTRMASPHAALALPNAFGEFAEAGYIIVSQDVRGKY